MVSNSVNDIVYTAIDLCSAAPPATLSRYPPNCGRMVLRKLTNRLLGSVIASSTILRPPSPDEDAMGSVIRSSAFCTEYIAESYFSLEVLRGISPWGEFFLGHLKFPGESQILQENFPRGCWVSLG